MKNILLSLSLCSVSLVPAAAVDFDLGVDASAALAAARAAAARPAPSYRPGGFDYQPDCQDIRFSAGETATTLGAYLESRELVSNCSNGHDDCRRTEGTRVTYGGAAITISNRKPLLPWESDAFRVCLEGTMVDLVSDDTAYEYRVVQKGSQANGWNWVVEPGAKKITKADPEGVSAEIVGGELVFSDKWATQYAGESVEIEFSVKREMSGPDRTVAAAVLKAPVKDSYRVLLNEGSFAGKLEAGRKYYAEYRVRRVGVISKDGFTRSRRSNPAEFRPVP